MPHPNAPSMGQWVSYTRTRPEARLSRCVRCTAPVPFLDRQPVKPIRGTSRLQRYHRSEQDLARITIGCIVVKWEEVPVIDADSGEVIDTKLRKTLVPMMMTGLGCRDCQWMMAEATAAVQWERELTEAEYRTIWVRDPRVYGANGLAMPTSLAQRERPTIREIKILLTPAARTPFIDVQEDVARCPRGTAEDRLRAASEVIVQLPSGPTPLSHAPKTTQAHLLHSITESLICDLIDLERPAEDLGNAASIAGHIAFRVSVELVEWRKQYQQEIAK